MNHISIAIDGPSGAGKSTLARALAADLGFLYVDTGAIYRTIGYYMLVRKVDPRDGPAVVAALPGIRLELRYAAGGEQHMLLNSQDVTAEIRLPQVSLYASAVSAHPGVRTYLLGMQRELAKKNDVIMDGRDIGTVVLPEADVKLFLTASAETRARRRCRELEERGTPEPFEKVLEEMKERDYRDIHRTAAPLRQAPDAVAVDTSELTFEESRQALREIIRRKIGR
jgi:cytidylate kinase